MAVTHGHGNPAWTKEETLLALNLLFQLQGKNPSAADERVQELICPLPAFLPSQFIPPA